jgi:hypothetical protein
MGKVKRFQSFLIFFVGLAVFLSAQYTAPSGGLSATGNNTFSGTNTVTGKMLLPAGTGAAPGIAFAPDGGTGWYKVTDGLIAGQDLAQQWTSSSVASNFYLDNDSARCQEGETAGERQICETYYRRIATGVRIMWLTDRYLRFGDPQGAAGGTFLGIGRLLADGASATTLHIGSFPGIASDAGFVYRDVKLLNEIHAGAAPGISGCSATIGSGSANTVGFYTSGTTGVCTVTLTFLTTAPTGWVCASSDETTGNLSRQTAYTQTTATVQGTTVSSDVVTYSCQAF